MIIIVIWVMINDKKENKVIEKESTKTQIVPAPKKVIQKETQEKTETAPKIVSTKTLKKPFNKLTKIAKKNLGKPYVFGKTGPESFDCSGFVYSMSKKIGVNLPRTALEQSKIKGQKISRDSLREGDLVFFDTALEGHVNHSGIYLGNSKFIHATSGKAYSVTISSLDAWYKDKFKWGKRLNANK
ncbi:MAG: Invasion associated protein p60 [uncultured Sulfurovum sp.]|uniref:Invasion associated protein p60 n=1 Tax=uncultured Sulfurovum sp. TaxID=269237 RepID=A0A6S6SE87_9BACT|nr:MAG: Invasion associated protein p60 [uncultured Sulfurovum sp.]